ncbi:bifunctional folylpolyglutamate synthase/dihydrofolate synthase [Agaribacter marinus]|uniref:Dihydrofolate synthase/folylpolyglutamate synthase n=1 Tax=Agaribacter marinus TaxID=1431249 RepID=A0AA37SVH1_9ALTE|nr:folylpolyglutamate synthase/dihydrofolate synthase family protein [Agaribacter marinus]GLR69449.1 bifunctional protein FolC [Agaribacter marinus]
MSKTLAQWLTFIEQSHPKEIDMGLSRTKQVLDNLNLDMRELSVITVAGTNGKGTTCGTIESILNACDISTGRYASPHMQRFNERIVVNQQEVSDSVICSAFEKVHEAQGATPLTYFEYATLAALVCFCDANVKVIILEVGLGGRLDATNVIDADVAVLTSIGLDHQDWLGDSLQGIANEKAGIIKPKSKVVIGFKPSEIGISYSKHLFITEQQDVLKYGQDYSVLEETLSSGEVGTRSGEINAPLLTLSDVGNADLVNADVVNTISIQRYSWQNPQVPAQNVMTALASVWQLTHVLAHIDRELQEQLLVGLKNATLVANAVNKVRLPGRVQTLNNKPLVIADVAHNQQAATYLHAQLLKYQYLQVKKIGQDINVYFVVGMLKDKNIEATLEVMSTIGANWYVCSIGTYRGESAQRLVSYLAKKQGSSNTQDIMAFDSIKEGVAAALESAKPTDIICIFGSFVTVADAIPLFLNTEVV